MSEEAAAVDVTIKAQFPFMMYHPSLPPMVVHSQEELEANMEKGWRTSPVPPSKKSEIKSKMKWHEEQLRRLKDQLAAINEEEAKIAVSEQIQKVEEAKQVVEESEREAKEKEAAKAASLTCSKCGKSDFKTVHGRVFHENACKGVKKEPGKKE